MRSDYAMFFDLPQTPRENVWLTERLETLSARESIILTAALQRKQPESIEDAINMLAELQEYYVRAPVVDYEDLGRLYLAEDAGLDLPDIVLEHTDLEALGVAFEDSHPGLFVGDCYVEYPTNPQAVKYDGTNLAEITDDSWAIKVKLSSPCKPDGVWLRLPFFPSDRECVADEGDMALKELHVSGFDDCKIMEAKCAFPGIDDLAAQYTSAEKLISDGNYLVCIMNDFGIIGKDHVQRLVAIADYEETHTLQGVIELAGRIRDYNFLRADKLEEYARSELMKAGVPEQLIDGGVFDLKGFAEESLEQNGYHLSNSGNLYIKPPQQEQQMADSPQLQM